MDHVSFGRSPSDPRVASQKSILYKARALLLGSGWFANMKTLLRIACLLLASANHAADATDPATPVSASGEAGVIVILGASYANAWPITTIAGMPVTNAGVNGDRTAELLARFENDVISRRPTHLLLWGFINDYSRSKASGYADAARGIEQNLTQMVDRAQASGIRVVLATEVTMPAAPTWHGELLASIYRSLGRQGYADRVNIEVMKSNAWLKSFAASRNLPVLDFQAAISPQGFYRDRQYSQPDGSHLNPAAYDALTAYVDTKQDSFVK